MRSPPKRGLTLVTTGYCYAPGVLDSLEHAAQKLQTLPETLRQRCETLRRRCELGARHPKDVAVVHLGAGVVGFLSGDTWRFRFPITAGEAEKPVAQVAASGEAEEAVVQ